MNLNNLYKLIQNRQMNLPKNSYVASFFKKSPSALLQKIGEEAIEVIISSNQPKKRKISEVSDLLFFLLIFLVREGITLKDIGLEFEKRNKKSIPS